LDGLDLNDGFVWINDKDLFELRESNDYKVLLELQEPLDLKVLKVLRVPLDLKGQLVVILELNERLAINDLKV
jgi:hypothetical protein